MKSNVEPKVEPNGAAPAPEPPARGPRRSPLLKAERVQERLRALPGWRQFPSVPGLERSHRFGTVREVLAFTQLAVEVFERYSVVPRLEISGDRVSIRVYSSWSPGEVTERDLKVAARLERALGAEP